MGGAIVLLAYAAWLLLSNGPPRVKSELDPLALVQLGVTILVGVLLQQLFSHEASVTQKQKDLIVEQIKAALECLDAVHLLHDSPGNLNPNDAFQRRISECKRLGMRLETVNRVLGHCEFGNGTEGAALLEVFLAYKTALTENVALSVADLTNARTLYQRLTEKAVLLIVDVNRG